MIAYMVWIGVSYFINEKFDKVQDKHRKPRVFIAQWCTTGFLWYTWLSNGYLREKNKLSKMILRI